MDLRSIFSRADEGTRLLDQKAPALRIGPFGICCRLRASFALVTSVGKRHL